MRLARSRMMHARRVIPHLVQMRKHPTGGNGRVVEPAIRKTMRAVQELRGRRIPVAMPILPHPVEVAIDAAARHDHVLGARLERRAARFIDTLAASDPAVARQEAIDPMPKVNGEPLRIGMAAQGADQGFRQTLACPPSHVETRHGIAGTEFATLDPIDNREKADAMAAHPAIDVRRAALNIGLRPRPGPEIFRAELSEVVLIAQRKIGGIANAQTPLLR